MQPRVKCLLVDDLEENLTALRALLRRDDVELLAARSSTEALELLLEHEVALALLDVQMPDIDGFELAELMRGSERTRHVPIIFVTAGACDQRRVFKGYETGAVDFLFKPIEPHILRSKAEVFFQLYRQNQQLVRQLHERTENLRLNEIFTAVLGHDLRNPLNAILSSASLLQQRAGEAATRDAAGRILSSGQRMSRLINDVLDFARARLTGGIPLKRDAANLGALIDRVVRELQTVRPGQAIEVSREGDLRGLWDADRLAQVASNLIGNALQHGDESDPVQVRLDGTGDDAVMLCVANSGSIPPDLLPHLFDPFQAGRHDPARREGFGLGLYIVQQIVGAHRGSIDVQSGPARRTTFKLTLPREALDP